MLDWRELDAGQFDAIASIGMSEHVGEDSIDDYARRLASLLRPGGRLLNHAIARLRHNDPPAGPFSERYVWPDAAPLQVSRVVSALEHAGLEIQTVEGFRKDYSQTLTTGQRVSTATTTRPSGSSAPSACASGGSTCASRATASTAASCRCSRSSRAGLTRAQPDSSPRATRCACASRCSACSTARSRSRIRCADVGRAP